MGDTRGETVYAGFPESLDSGVPRGGIETSPEGRARGEGWIGRAGSSRRNSAGLALMRMPDGESFRTSSPSVVFWRRLLRWPLRLWKLLQELVSFLFLPHLKLPLHGADLTFGAPPSVSGPDTQNPSPVRKQYANRLVGYRFGVIHRLTRFEVHFYRLLSFPMATFQTNGILFANQSRGKGISSLLGPL